MEADTEATDVEPEGSPGTGAPTTHSFMPFHEQVGRKSPRSPKRKKKSKSKNGRAEDGPTVEEALSARAKKSAKSFLPELGSKNQIAPTPEPIREDKFSHPEPEPEVARRTPVPIVSQSPRTPTQAMVPGGSPASPQGVQRHRGVSKSVPVKLQSLREPQERKRADMSARSHQQKRFAVPILNLPKKKQPLPPPPASSRPDVFSGAFNRYYLPVDLAGNTLAADPQRPYLSYNFYDVKVPWDQEDPALDPTTFNIDSGYLRLYWSRRATEEVELELEKEEWVGEYTAGAAVNIELVARFVRGLQPRSVLDFKPMFTMLQGLLVDLIQGKLHHLDLEHGRIRAAFDAKLAAYERESQAQIAELRSELIQTSDLLETVMTKLDDTETKRLLEKRAARLRALKLQDNIMKLEDAVLQRQRREAEVHRQKEHLEVTKESLEARVLELNDAVAANVAKHSDTKSHLTELQRYCKKIEELNQKLKDESVAQDNKLKEQDKVLRETTERLESFQEQAQLNAKIEASREAEQAAQKQLKAEQLMHRHLLRVLASHVKRELREQQGALAPAPPPEPDPPSSDPPEAPGTAAGLEERPAEGEAEAGAAETRAPRKAGNPWAGGPGVAPPVGMRDRQVTPRERVAALKRRQEAGGAGPAPEDLGAKRMIVDSSDDEEDPKYKGSDDDDEEAKAEEEEGPARPLAKPPPELAAPPEPAPPAAPPGEGAGAGAGEGAGERERERGRVAAMLSEAETLEGVLNADVGGYFEEVEAGTAPDDRVWTMYGSEDVRMLALLDVLQGHAPEGEGREGKGLTAAQEEAIGGRLGELRAAMEALYTQLEEVKRKAQIESDAHAKVIRELESQVAGPLPEALQESVKSMRLSAASIKPSQQSCILKMQHLKSILDGLPMDKPDGDSEEGSQQPPPAGPAGDGDSFRRGSVGGAGPKRAPAAVERGRELEMLFGKGGAWQFCRSPEDMALLARIAGEYLEGVYGARVVVTSTTYDVHTDDTDAGGEDGEGAGTGMQHEVVYSGLGHAVGSRLGEDEAIFHTTALDRAKGLTVFPDAGRTVQPIELVQVEAADSKSVSSIAVRWSRRSAAAVQGSMPWGCVEVRADMPTLKQLQEVPRRSLGEFAAARISGAAQDPVRTMDVLTMLAYGLGRTQARIEEHEYSKLEAITNNVSTVGVKLEELDEQDEGLEAVPEASPEAAPQEPEVAELPPSAPTGPKRGRVSIRPRMSVMGGHGPPGLSSPSQGPSFANTLKNTDEDDARKKLEERKGMLGDMKMKLEESRRSLEKLMTKKTVSKNLLELQRYNKPVFNLCAVCVSVFMVLDSSMFDKYLRWDDQEQTYVIPDQTNALQPMWSLVQKNFTPTELLNKLRTWDPTSERGEHERVHDEAGRDMSVEHLKTAQWVLSKVTQKMAQRSSKSSSMVREWVTVTTQLKAIYHQEMELQDVENNALADGKIASLTSSWHKRALQTVQMATNAI